MQRKSRLSLTQTHMLIEHFNAGVPARTSSVLSGVSRRIATERYRLFKHVIATRLRAHAPLLSGEIETDERYFGDRRKGKRGRGAPAKIPVFGVYKRNGLSIRSKCR